MGCCCFCPSFSSSSKSKAPLSHLYPSPVPKSQVTEAQLPAAAAAVQLEIHQVAIISNSISQTLEEIQIGDGKAKTSIVEKKVHFSSRVAFIKDEANEDVCGGLMSLEADSKQSSGEGESCESLFSLQLVDGWSTSNEEEVMSKEISNNIFTSRDESLDEGFTFPISDQSNLIQNEEELSKTKSKSLSGVPNEEGARCESEEVSVETSLSSWLVDLEPENTNNTAISKNAVKDSITEKPNGGSEKRRVLGELSLVEVNENQGQSLKSSGFPRSIGDYLNIKAQTAADFDSYGSSIQNIQPGMRRSGRERSRLHKADQKVDLQKAIPLGLSLARAAMATGIV